MEGNRDDGCRTCDRGIEASRHGEVPSRPNRRPMERNGPISRAIGLVIILALVALTAYAAWWALHPLVDGIDGVVEDVRDPYEQSGVIPGPGMRLVQFDVNVTNSLVTDVEVVADGFTLEHQEGVSHHDVRISMERTTVPSGGASSFIIGFEVPEDAAVLSLSYDYGDWTFIIML